MCGCVRICSDCVAGDAAENALAVELVDYVVHPVQSHILLCILFAPKHTLTCGPHHAIYTPRWQFDCGSRSECYITLKLTLFSTASRGFAVYL